MGMSLTKNASGMYPEAFFYYPNVSVKPGRC